MITLDINATPHDKITTLMVMPSANAIADEFMRLGVNGQSCSDDNCPVANFLLSGDYSVDHVSVTADEISWIDQQGYEGIRNVGGGVLSVFIELFDNLEYPELNAN